MYISRQQSRTCSCTLEHDLVATNSAPEHHSSDDSPCIQLHHQRSSAATAGVGRRGHPPPPSAAAVCWCYAGRVCANCGATCSACLSKDEAPGRHLCNLCGLYKYRKVPTDPITPQGACNRGPGGCEAASVSCKLGPGSGDAGQQQQQAWCSRVSSCCW